MFELELVVTEIGCYLLKSALCANSGEEGATRGAAKSWFLEVTTLLIVQLDLIPRSLQATGGSGTRGKGRGEYGGGAWQKNQGGGGGEGGVAGSQGSSGQHR